MSSALKHQYANNKDVAIIDMNKDNLSSVKNIGSVEGFPTMKYITNRGNTIELYEDSSIKNKDRSADSFVNWIESKILKGKMISHKPVTTAHHVYKRIQKNHSKSHSKGKSSKTRKQRMVKKGKSRKNKQQV